MLLFPFLLLSALMQTTPAIRFGDLGLRSRSSGTAPVLPTDTSQLLQIGNVSVSASIMSIVTVPALAETAERSQGDVAGATVAYFWIGLSLAAGIKGIVDKMKET